MLCREPVRMGIRHTAHRQLPFLDEIPSFLGAAFSAEPAAPLQLLLLPEYMLKSYQDIGDLEYNAHANIKNTTAKLDILNRTQ